MLFHQLRSAKSSPVMHINKPWSKPNIKCQMSYLTIWGFYDLTLAEISIIIQSVIFVLFLVSMTFRMKSKYFVHVVILLVAIISMLSFFAWWVYEVAPTFDSYLPTLLSPTLNFVNWITHELLGILTLVLGAWVVFLWRLDSTKFESKSKRVWRLTEILWILAYVVGLLLFIILNTNLI
jgi:uncharacterized membrane protein YozB (DUF420 family)